MGECGGWVCWSDVSAFWQDLYKAGADVVLNGHAHGYERFAPQTPNQSPDAKRGIREFVVGTGGEDFHPFTTTKPLSQARQDAAFGVLLLTLHPGSYDWQFSATPAGSYSDSGTTSCH